MIQKKILLFNCTNVVKGGAIQAVVNFLSHQLVNGSDIIWYYALSKEVQYELEQLNIHLPSSRLLVLLNSPAKNMISRKSVLTFENKVHPDLIFTFFGPSYIKFKSPEISGFANGWVTHSTFKNFFETHNSIWKVIISIIKYIYYGFNIRSSYAWILETETARQGFIRRLRVPHNKTFVVPNTCINFNDNFTKKEIVSINGFNLRFSDNLFVALSSNYPHKNLKILVNAAKTLRDKYGCDFKIILTLDDSDFAEYFLPSITSLDLHKYFLNVGKVSINDIPKLYAVAKCSILPSFIETYSAVYPESFATKTPIITSNRDFARDICKNAALFVDPHNFDNIADSMYLILTDFNIVSKLVNNGSLLNNVLLDGNQKYMKYIDVFDHVFKTLQHKKTSK